MHPSSSADLGNAIEAALLIYDECEASSVNGPVCFSLAVSVVRQMLKVELRTACLVMEGALLARELTKAKNGASN